MGSRPTYVNGKRISGGSSTTVIANPTGTATADLNTVQIGNTIYDIPSGGGGGGSTSRDYSYTEHKIGTWVDGSDLYECSFNPGWQQQINSNFSWYNIGISISNVNILVDAEVHQTSSGAAVWKGFDARINSGSLEIRNHTMQNETLYTSSVITARYTKTS